MCPSVISLHNDNPEHFLTSTVLVCSEILVGSVEII